MVSFARAQNVRISDEPAEAPDGLLQALDCLRIAITVYDGAERLSFANRHFDHLFPDLPPRETLIGATYGEIVRLEAQSGAIAARALAAGIDAFVEQRRTQLTSGDFRPCDIELADGRIIEIKSRRTPGGGWIVLWSDVTGARQTLGRLEDAIAMSADAFAFFDPNDKLAVCNKDYAALHGAGVESLRGRAFGDILRDTVDRGRIRLDGDPENWMQRRIDLHRAPAAAMTLELTNGAAFLVRDRHTRHGYVSVLTDITDERRVESALAETQAQLKTSQEQARYLADLTHRLDAAAASADTTKTTLLRTMSHELKTPLNAIIGFSDLLNQMADRFEADQVREYAALILSGGQNLLKLINHILDLTKVAAGKFEARPVRIDVAGALWLAREAHLSRAEAKGIAVELPGGADDLFVEADENAFKQMLAHLVENAVAFTPEGGRVTLSAARIKERVRLIVSDNGPGVAAEDLARILEPFEQVGRSTTDHAQGAGLGLTLVKAFAELHGGSLAIESAPGAGFAATIELPAA